MDSRIMNRDLVMISSIGDDDQKLERYKRILSLISSSNDMFSLMTFINHVLSVEKSWTVSRQLLQAMSLEMWRWKHDEKAQILEYIFAQASESDWKLDEALAVFDINSQDGEIVSSLNYSPVQNVNGFNNGYASDGDDVRQPIPIVQDTLYGDGYANRNPEMSREAIYPDVWKSDNDAATANDHHDNLASLYCPPSHLACQGSFDNAKKTASMENKWLIVNVQSTTEFASHMLNRDTWGNEFVAETIRSSFIFWQVDQKTMEGRKVCTFYKEDSTPAVLILDPITGQRLHSWTGMVDPETLIERLERFMGRGPQDDLVAFTRKRSRENPSKRKDDTHEEVESARNLAASTSDGTSAVASDVKGCTTISQEKETHPTNKLKFAPLPEEPQVDMSLLCRVGVRLPDGRRVQRKFLKTDPIQLLWSFCDSQIDETEKRAFRLKEALPGAKSLDYESNMTFDKSGLANSMITLVWE